MCASVRVRFGVVVAVVFVVGGVVAVVASWCVCASVRIRFGVLVVVRAVRLVVGVVVAVVIARRFA